MKHIAWIISVILLTRGVAFAKNYEMTPKTGDYTIQITIDKNPPATEKNNIAIGTKDKTGKEVTGAWIITAKIAHGGKTQSVKLNVDIK